MPVCPGCERTVPYEKLAVHEEYCEKLQNADASALSAVESLDNQIRAVERRMYRRIRAMEAELDISRSRTDGESNIGEQQRSQ